MMLLIIDEIIAIHGKLIAKTSGSDGILDRGFLESAVYSANNSFDEVEQYPSVEEKSARLAFPLTTIIIPQSPCSFKGQECEFHVKLI